MSIHRLLRPFRNKLLWENACRSAITALTLGAAGVFCAALIYHILVRQISAVILGIVGGSIFCISFLLLFFLRWPTAKKVALRLDALGLQERVSTMLEFAEDASPMAQLQRRDAIAHIQKTSPKQLSVSLPKRNWVLCLVALCLAVVMVLLPYDLFAVPPEPLSPEQLQQQMLQELITQLRQDAKDAQLDEKVSTSIQQILDQLEEELKNAQGDLERAAAIQEAIEQLQEQQNQLSTRQKIGKALQNQELTKELGIGISNNNTEKISSALDSLEAALNEDRTLPLPLNDAVVTALVESEVADTDLLYNAVARLSYPMVLLDVQSDSYPHELNTVFEEAEAAIWEALKQQADAQQQLEAMQQALKDAMDGQMGNEPPSEQPTGEQQEGEKPEGDPQEGQAPEDMPAGSAGDVPGEEGTIRTEGFYDPISGNVSYGEVFAAYYAEYLKALEAGKVPQYLQEIMDRYFAALD